MITATITFMPGAPIAKIRRILRFGIQPILLNRAPNGSGTIRSRPNSAGVLNFHAREENSICVRSYSLDTARNNQLTFVSRHPPFPIPRRCSRKSGYNTLFRYRFGENSTCSYCDALVPASCHAKTGRGEKQAILSIIVFV